MTASNFENMNKEQLRVYVRQNPHDIEAFHKYVDMVRATPGRIRIPADQIDTELPKLLQAN
ncbi:MAG: hypothetical protein PUP92_31940 [Rhizonema sp. PD38]|nr:hypothetical protein [Rhizonema sp. PD38]